MKLLPPELLSKIFLFTTAAARQEPNIYYLQSDVTRSYGNHDPITAAVYLSSVCKCWRAVALDYSALWTCIVIDLQSRDYDSGDDSLDRRFALQDAYLRTVVPRYRQQTTEVTILASTFVPQEQWTHIRRWWDLLAPQARSVYLCGGMWWEQPSFSEHAIDWEDTIFSILATPTPPTPYLERCVLTSDDFVHGMRDLMGLLPASPRLRTLLLRGISVRRVLNAIGRTAISTLVLYEDTELDRLWNLKDKAPELERLVLRTGEMWSKKLRPPQSLHTLVLYTGAQRCAAGEGPFSGVHKLEMHPCWDTNEARPGRRMDLDEDDMDEFTDSSVSTDVSD